MTMTIEFQPLFLRELQGDFKRVSFSKAFEIHCVVYPTLCGLEKLLLNFLSEHRTYILQVRFYTIWLLDKLTRAVSLNPMNDIGQIVLKYKFNFSYSIFCSTFLISSWNVIVFGGHPKLSSDSPVTSIFQTSLQTKIHTFDQRYTNRSLLEFQKCLLGYSLACFNTGAQLCSLIISFEWCLKHRNEVGVVVTRLRLQVMNAKKAVC